MDIFLRLEGERLSNIQKIIYGHFFFKLQDSGREDGVRKWESSCKHTSDWPISNDPDEEEMGNVPQGSRVG